MTNANFSTSNENCAASQEKTKTDFYICNIQPKLVSAIVCKMRCKIDKHGNDTPERNSSLYGEIRI